jgi:hypothetical protein
VLFQRRPPDSDFGAPPPPESVWDLWLSVLDQPLEQVDLAPEVGIQVRTDAAQMSGDGAWIVYRGIRRSGAGLVGGIYARNATTRITRRIDVEPGQTSADASPSQDLGLSRNGRWLVLRTIANRLVPGDIDGSSDLFLADLQLGGLVRLAQPGSGLPLVNNDYTQISRMAVSDDARFVVFVSTRSDLPQATEGHSLYRLDRQTSSLRRVAPLGHSGIYGDSGASASAEGRWVAFQSTEALVPQDTNQTADVYLLDASSDTLRLASVDAVGRIGDRISFRPAISLNGQALVFASHATRFIASPAVVSDGPGIFIKRLDEPPLFASGFE